MQHDDRRNPDAPKEADDLGAVFAGHGEKLSLLLRSRRFWTCVAATAVSGVLYGFGEIDGGQFTNAVTLIAGIYIGSIALEDGLHNLISIWLRAPDAE